VRVTSSLWVSAFVRRTGGDGTAVVVERRGAEEAGAIFIVVDRLDGTADLYGPAPQAVFDEGKPSDRLFQKLAVAVSRADIEERLRKETRFDPDIWVVTVESRSGTVELATV
jgi:hypothetical protein